MQEAECLRIAGGSCYGERCTGQEAAIVCVLTSKRRRCKSAASSAYHHI